jgi:hypothetical protein
VTFGPKPPAALNPDSSARIGCDRDQKNLIMAEKMSRLENAACC